MRSEGTAEEKYYMWDQMALQGHRIIYFSIDIVISIIINGHGQDFNTGGKETIS